jgi:hypothetical protein
MVSRTAPAGEAVGQGPRSVAGAGRLLVATSVAAVCEVRVEAAGGRA